MKRIYYSLFLIILFSLGCQIIYAQDEYKTIKNVAYYDESQQGDEYIKSRCLLDIYYPVNKEKFTTIVWFHGGGIKGGEKFIPEQWKNKGIAVVAVNYRLSPKVKCPEYIKDAAAAVAWTFTNINKYGGDSTKIVVSGHSAGGYLTSMIGLDKSYLAAFGIDNMNIAALIPFSGHTITHMTVREERGISDKQPIVDEFAPLFYVGAKTPPLYLFTGDRELEMLGRYEENAYMWRMMKVNGNEHAYLFEFDGFDHGAMLVPGYALTFKILKDLGL